MLFVLLDDLHSSLKIAEIVQRIKHPEDIDAVVASALSEGFHHVVGVVLVAHQVLPAQQHGKGSFGDVFLQRADAFPGIFAEIAVHGVKSGSTPHFHGVIAHLIHELCHVQQIFGSATSSEK